MIILFLWMIVPLVMTLWFSFQHYNLLDPPITGFAGFENYTYLLTDPSLWTAMVNTLVLVGWVLVITVGFGTLLAVLFDQDFFGRSIARLLAIAPFFVMPTVSALIWKNMLMHPVNGLFACFTRSLGLPADRLVRQLAADLGHHHRGLAMAALRPADPADRDPVARPRAEGSRPHGRRRAALDVLLHHPAASRPRRSAVVVMIETIFLLSIFAEIFVTTSGGPGSPRPTSPS